MTFSIDQISIWRGWFNFRRWFYPSVGKERVAFFNQDGFDDGLVHDAQNGLSRIVDTMRNTNNINIQFRRVHAWLIHIQHLIMILHYSSYKDFQSCLSFQTDVQIWISSVRDALIRFFDSSLSLTLTPRLVQTSWNTPHQNCETPESAETNVFTFRVKSKVITLK